MSRRAIIGLLGLLQQAGLMGVDVEAILAAHGLPLACIDPAQEIDRAVELVILEQVALQLPDGAAGLRLGEANSVAVYGPLLMMMICCADGFEAMRTGVRFQELTFLQGRLHMEQGEETTALIVDVVPLSSQLSRMLIDSDMAGTFRFVRDVQRQLGVEYPTEEVWVPYPRPPEFRAYEEYYQCHVKFDMPQARLVLRNQFLAMPFPSANGPVFHVYERQAEALLAERHREQSLAVRVADHLSIFVEKIPGVEEVARAFGMTPRALRERLAEEGRNFRDILLHTRFERAKRYLAASSLSVERISRVLGYSEPASFIHAFQRLAGVSPSVYREQQGLGKSA